MQRRTERSRKDTGGALIRGGQDDEEPALAAQGLRNLEPLSRTGVGVTLVLEAGVGTEGVRVRGAVDLGPESTIMAVMKTIVRKAGDVTQPSSGLGVQTSVLPGLGGM